MKIILGPPGTGKTTRLLGVVEDALKFGIKPNKIGYFSFTRKAAQEAMQRACLKFKLNELDFPYFRTLHSLAFKCLGMNSAAVFNGRRLTEFGHLMGLELSGKTFDPVEGIFAGATLDDRLIFMEQYARTTGVDPAALWAEHPPICSWWEFERVVRGVQAFKDVRGLIDFNDMLLNVTDKPALLPKFELLVIDEAQDLSWAQWRLVEVLVERSEMSYIAGDDDQAIFKWAGADVDYFIDRIGQTEVLNKSWRLPRKIAALAKRITNRIKNRRYKKWGPRDAEGHVSLETKISHLDLTKGTWLILARNKFLLNELEEDVKDQGVYYSVMGKSSVDPAIIQAQLKGERFVATLAETQYIASLKDLGEDLTKAPRVKLSTIHGAKGGEADSVILCSDASRAVADCNHTDDEARVAYVGVTRARENLYILENRTRFTLLDNFDIMLKEEH